MARARFEEALERRAASLPEGVRRRLASVSGKGGKLTSHVPQGRVPVRLAERPAPLPGLLSMLSAAQASAAVETVGLAAVPAAYPELSQLDFFRETWSRLGAVRELRQSRARVPENAGPLNSSHLMHQSLALMRELSPGYLQQFLAYVDALSWMEQLQQASLGTSLGKAPARRALRAVRSKP